MGAGAIVYVATVGCTHIQIVTASVGFRQSNFIDSNTITGPIAVVSKPTGIVVITWVVVVGVETNPVSSVARIIGALVQIIAATLSGFNAGLVFSDTGTRAIALIVDRTGNPVIAACPGPGIGPNTSLVDTIVIGTIVAVIAVNVFYTGTSSTLAI